MASCMRIRLEEYIKKERTGSDNLLIELRFLLISLTFFSSFVLSAQVEETLQESAGNDSTTLNNLNSGDDLNQLEMINWDVDAHFPGGAAAMKRFIQENMRYPELSQDQGRVYVSFVVEMDGSISNVEILRPLTPLLDQEAIRIICSMPNWIPSKVKGETMRTRCRLPITFTLPE